MTSPKMPPCFAPVSGESPVCFIRIIHWTIFSPILWYHRMVTLLVDRYITAVIPTTLHCVIKETVTRRCHGCCEINVHKEDRVKQPRITAVLLSTGGRKQHQRTPTASSPGCTAACDCSCNLLHNGETSGVSIDSSDFCNNVIVEVQHYKYS